MSATTDVPATEPPGLRERKKLRTRADICAAAVSLIAAHGLAEVRVEDICTEAEVGRSTFFRYFDSKESAFVEGVHARRVESVAAEVGRRPAEETGFEAVQHAVLAMAADWQSFRDDMVLEARLRAESATVRAWAAESSERWVAEIAGAVVPRVGGDVERAAVIAAASIAALQVAYGIWITAGAAEDPSPVLRRCFDALRQM
jgi:AcrR family transcriptional regulator